MLASSIRELATSNNPTWIAAALLEKTVQIWDLESLQRISEFPTVFCAGAKNLALAPHGGMLVAGLSRRKGKVAAYDVPSGRKVWELRLVYPSLLRAHTSGQSILCTTNRQSVVRLDIQTGNILEVIDGTKRYVEEPSGCALSIPGEVGDSPIQLLERGQTFDLDRPRFAVLDVQFSPHSVCLAEAAGRLYVAGGQARGRVRCISRFDGSLQWTFDPGADSHILRLHYSPFLDVFFGILWNFEKGGPRSLLRFEPANGINERICEFNSWEEIFLDGKDQLVTSAGEIWNLSDGSLVGQFAFPSREYPDD